MAQGNKFKHAVKEASYHLVRHLGTTVCAVVSICLSLLITGMFAVGSISLRNMLANVENSIIVSAFVDDAAEQEKLDAFEK
jgi:cell division protein FtsX